MTTKKTTDPTPVPVTPPPLPADVTSISWWFAMLTWGAGEAMAVGVLVGHPLSSTAVNGALAIAGQVVAVVGPVVAYLTHGKVKAAHIQAAAAVQPLP